jgi:hypothetical protein
MSTKTVIDHKAGIWDSEITIIDHGDYATVNFPYVNWKGSSGRLAFKKLKVTVPRGLKFIREVIREENGFPMDLYDFGRSFADDFVD